MRKRKTGTRGNGGIWIGLGSGLLAFLGGIGCCAFPIAGSVLAFAGVTGGFIDAIRPWQPLFIAMAAVALAFEFYKAYRPTRPRAVSCCGNRSRRRLLLWIVTIFTGCMLVLQHFATIEPDGAGAGNPCGCDAEQNDGCGEGFPSGCCSGPE